MKKLWITIILLVGFAPQSQAQTPEVTQLILNIEKLNQLRKILSELKKGYEILFKGYNTIRDISRGNFKLHEAFLDGLLEVSPAVKNYQRVKDIVTCQLALINEYRAAYRTFSSGDHFSRDELAYMEDVYSKLIAQSVKNLDALATIVTAKKLRASDDERLKAIDEIYAEMADMLTFLRHFNSNTSVLATQRSNEKTDLKVMQQLLNLEP